MRRFILAAATSLSLTIAGGPALAGSKWCVVDPAITVDGRTSDVTVMFDEGYIPAVLPPVTFRFHVPVNSTATVLFPPSPIAYTVEVLYDLPARPKREPVTVTVDTLVTATAAFGTQTVVHLPRGVIVSVSGASGSTTTVTYSVR